MAGFRRAYSIAGVVLLALLALQFYLIAAAALHVWGAATADSPTSAQVFAGFKQGDTFANLHAANGTIVIPLTILVMIGLAFGARHSARVKWQTGGLFGLMVLQFILAGIGFTGNAVAGAIAGLHGVNALAIVGLSVSLVYRNWAFAAERHAQPSAAGAPSPTSGMGASGL